MLQTFWNIVKMLLTIEHIPKRSLILLALGKVHDRIITFSSGQRHSLVAELLFSDTNQNVLSPREAWMHGRPCFYFVIWFRVYSLQLCIVDILVCRFIISHFYYYKPYLSKLNYIIQALSKGKWIFIIQSSTFFKNAFPSKERFSLSFLIVFKINQLLNNKKYFMLFFVLFSSLFIFFDIYLFWHDQELHFHFLFLRYQQNNSNEKNKSLYLTKI